jgi:peptidoglycan/xylan/chitin deacetylase (PgdA/CDA1 family)
MALSLTVDVEEWYHGLWPGSDQIVSEYYGHKIPKGTFVEPLQHILEIFEKHHVRSTFFVLGETAEYAPEMIEKIYGLGHEIASHSCLHRDLTKLSLTEIEKTEKEYRRFLRKITGETPKGFRAPLFKINSDVIHSLRKVGYTYDSSVTPSIPIPGWFGYYRAPLDPYVLAGQRTKFFEVPVTVFPLVRLPAGGGWFLRNLGVNYVKTAIRFLLRKKLPAVLYIHPLDARSGVPKLRNIPFHVTRNCGEYTLRAVGHILRTFGHCKKLAIRDILAELYGVSH